uniref:Metal-nicotianamine transporter YSL7 n=1 Tax=Nelumbo nucifera TaxID=4432 RepID=A0A822YLF1_NELNU|nr:TPA_asm: hypothetical protein HUJ06_011262 [Nelumbo nucifera]
MKVNLTTGIIPSLNVSAGLLGFFFVKSWTKLLEKSGMLRQTFTWQENTIIQTCVVAISIIPFCGDFGSYILGMSLVEVKQSAKANAAQNVKNPELGWMIGFLFVVSILGLFSIVPLHKIMIVDFKLTYPSGTATTHLIDSFHTPQGVELAKNQDKELGKFFSFSFLWSLFQWSFAAGDDCGFAKFPSLGLNAYENKYIINISLLIGGILSCGIMWPLNDARKGDWYLADLSKSSLYGLQGYKIFNAIAMILGDGLYNFMKILIQTLICFFHQLHSKNTSSVLPIADPPTPRNLTLSYDDQCCTRLFLKDLILSRFALVGYVVISAISIGTLPHIFPQLKWYHVLVIYIFAPILAFCNAYGCGLSDWSLASTYGKLAIFIVGAWAGTAICGVIASLAARGVMMNIVSPASDLMQDFKTGYLTLTSPHSMFVSQVVGTAMGRVISPCVFWLFYKAFPDIGVADSEYPAPYALVYRNMLVLGVEGFSALPKHCITLSFVFFIAAALINLTRDVVGEMWARFIPVPMAMEIPFYVGSYFAIDMCVGSLILFVWEKTGKESVEAFGSSVASGLICGDGILALPSSVLALIGEKPPICMKFLSRATNAKVDRFLLS